VTNKHSIRKSPKIKLPNIYLPKSTIINSSPTKRMVKNRDKKGYFLTPDYIKQWFT